MPTLTIRDDPAPFAPSPDGNVRVVGTRVGIEHILIRHLVHGETPESIAADYAHVGLANVYAVLAYYHRHKAEVDAYLAAYQREEEEALRRIDERYDQAAFAARMRARRAELAAAATAGNGG